MLNEFVTPVLILSCNSHQLMSYQKLLIFANMLVFLWTQFCNSWHQQWHSVERPYSVNQQKRLNITTKCHDGVLSLIIDCRLTFYPSYQKKHPLWATAYCFNKMTWKCRSSPITMQSSVYLSKSLSELRNLKVTWSYWSYKEALRLWFVCQDSNNGMSGGFSIIHYSIYWVQCSDHTENMHQNLI